MANIIVTTVDANHVKVDFNAYYPSAYLVSTAYYNRSLIEMVELYADYVEVQMSDGIQWKLAHNTVSGTFEVDSIDGTSITTNAQLATLIGALMVA